MTRALYKVLHVGIALAGLKMTSISSEPLAKRSKASRSVDEILLLVQAVNQKKDIIYGRYGRMVTSADKKVPE